MSKEQTENKTTVKKEPTKKKTTKKVPVKAEQKKRGRKPAVTLEEANAVYHVSLLAQAVCVVGILFITLLAIFENSFTVPIEVLVGITLFIMGYNNYKIYKRKGLTAVYIVFGVIAFIVGILGYFGVTL